MARIFPGGWNDRLVRGVAQREDEMLSILHRGLPDTYCFYRGVHWTQRNKVFDPRRTDFVVVSPASRVLVIEQKSGKLKEVQEDLV